ncbi:hypothetical protein DFH08DRAFT_981175 [Mycena albidolilacea]|uniref:C2H2-type domain-containing protein n=1 Tax=Mycena albidolilacea TaxID=1033008 RepID=A0AAD7AUQ7_9AGAR|nr:hypothetical protein DFH08DRAFT_981175 [Mycena albidolilacea]
MDTNTFRIPTSVQDFDNSINLPYTATDRPPIQYIDPPAPTREDNPSALYCKHTVPTPRLDIPVSAAAAALGPRVPKRKAPTQDASPKKRQKKGIEPERAVAFGTSILDAHYGITQAELEAKAARYQQCNPGVEDFDKLWLALFSGKLTAAGEMTEDFRCYVVGCSQVNRRRDHMVVHVGSHLDQRMFKCEHCPKRYRRKNQLNRHERDHDGLRPFVCPLCPASFKIATFKRGDLLNCHIKSMHGRWPSKYNAVFK